MRLLGRLRSRARYSTLRLAVALLALSALRCGGGDDDDGSASTFTATEPPDDACALLDKADIATILPKNDGGMLGEVQAVPELWVRSCTYTDEDDPVQQVDLVLEGAIDEAGNNLIHRVANEGPSDGLKEHVAGVGDTATYWVNDGLSTLGLIAAWRGYGVGVTAYSVAPPPTKDKLVPLIVKVIGKLP